MNVVVVDLASAQGVQHACIMLSQVTSLVGLGVLRLFTPHCIFCCLPQDLCDELAWITCLDKYMHLCFKEQMKGNTPEGIPLSIVLLQLSLAWLGSTFANYSFGSANLFW